MESKIESQKNFENNKQFQNKKQNNPQKKIKVPFEEEIFMRVIPEVFFKNGLRFIKDYSHVYRTYVKKRWEDQSIYQVFCKEFLAYSSEYYVNGNNFLNMIILFFKKDKKIFYIFIVNSLLFLYF